MLETALTIMFNPLQASTGTAQPAANIYSFLGLAVFMVFIVSRRIYSGMNGRIYRNSRIFSLPIIYLLLTLYSIIPLGLANISYFYVLTLVPLGILVGLRFGGNVSFFIRNNVLYYKRSPFILAFWLASFVLRISLIYVYPGNNEVFFVVDAILSLTSGLIIGESLHTLNKRKKFSEDQERDPFGSATSFK